MADAAEEQAGILAKELHPVPPFAPSLRSRLTVFLVSIFGPRAMRPVLSASKVRGVSVYRGKLEPEGHPWPTSAEEVGRRHKSFGGGTLRAGVFGVNDGLVSNTCLVMGVAGAAVEPSVLVLTGVAGLLAGAFSMTAGEYVSMLSQKEMFEHQIAQEKDELERYPKEEAEELALIYAARGIPLEEARDVAAHLIANPDKALDTLAREELGLNPDDLGSPTGAAVSSFICFAIGASLPIIPFLLKLPNGLVVAAAIFRRGAVRGRRGAQPFLGQERMARRVAHVLDRQRRGSRDLFHRLIVQSRGRRTLGEAAAPVPQFWRAAAAQLDHGDQQCRVRHRLLHPHRGRQVEHLHQPAARDPLFLSGPRQAGIAAYRRQPLYRDLPPSAAGRPAWPQVDHALQPAPFLRAERDRPFLARHQEPGAPLRARRLARHPCAEGQARRGQADKVSNWLPAPDDEFSLYIRAYWALEALNEGGWTPPPVVLA
jgi:VIT1/CCC1 family predicted Fe2+/Mn2+ transporter